jgi:hypothetical protein
MQNLDTAKGCAGGQSQPASPIATRIQKIPSQQISYLLPGQWGKQQGRRFRKGLIIEHFWSRVRSSGLLDAGTCARTANVSFSIPT